MIVWTATGPRWSRAPFSLPGAKPIAGYLADKQKMIQEYRQFYGKPLNDAGIERAFEQAGQYVSAKDYNDAVALLEQVSKVAAVPVVFNNLGVLYAEVNDNSRAINAFREALGRDVNYGAVRRNLDRLKNAFALDADPVTREAEPNNDTNLANIIAAGNAVDGEIDAAIDDDDFFRFVTPPAPRDLISIEIANHSTTLVPVLRIFDQERRMTDWGRIAHEPGASLQLTIAPAPNTTLYLQVSGLGHSGGAYTLLARPQKAFDAYEPNDEISNARRIPVGTAVAAGIMDANDTDYYSFVSPRTGTVSIAIANRSTTLIPALSTFEPDMRPSGSAPDVGTPGLNLKHTIQVRENQTYYIQVRPLNNTAGDYTLMIE
jgi:tetratricopeptide (TPR) repeat protein